MEVVIVQMGFSHYYRVRRKHKPYGRTLRQGTSVEELVRWAGQQGYKVVAVPEEYKHVQLA